MIFIFYWVKSMPEENNINWQPFWTSDVKIESGGRYPLGLNHFHSHLDTLINRNIVYGADKLHYISFYCWAIGDINATESFKDYAEFVEHFQRRENAFSLGLYMNEHDYTVRGSDKLSIVYNQNSKEYNTSFRLMKSSPMGAYGLYYGGVIYGFGLIGINEKGIPSLTNSGNELYKFMDGIYKKTQYWKTFKGEKTVPADVLSQFGKLNDLYCIRNQESLEERNIYRRLIFYLTSKGRILRRDTFMLYLHCVEECFKKDIEFDFACFWSIIYFNKCYNKQDRVTAIDLPEYLHEIQFYWKIYFGHSLFRWWVEEYFRVFLSHLKIFSEGATISEFIASIDVDDFNRTIGIFLKSKGDFFDSDIGSIIKRIDNSIDLSKSYSEYAVHYENKHETSSSLIARMVLILICLIIRFKPHRKDKRFQDLIMNLSGDLWFGNLLIDFPEIETVRVNDFLRRVLHQYIIIQHNEIMYQKNDLRRCWFTIEQDRYYFQSDNNPLWGDGHFGTVMGYLFDMNLINYKGKAPVLTNEGKKFHEMLLKEFY